MAPPEFQFGSSDVSQLRSDRLELVTQKFEKIVENARNLKAFNDAIMRCISACAAHQCGRLDWRESGLGTRMPSETQESQHGVAE